MKKLLIFVAIIAAIAAFLLPSINRIPTLDEHVTAKWSEVLNQYNRRADLVPNLVNTVKGYAAHEKDTFLEVVEARKQVTNLKVDANTLNNPALFQQFAAAQDGLSSALSKLLVTVERYPDLKASTNFVTLQSQLEGTENRIAVARRDYIETVRAFNTEIRTFPGRLWNTFLYNMSNKENFTVEEQKMEVPDVTF